MFVDEVDITVRAGKGGDGCVAFLREKYRPLGGPAGGNGGRGGSVVFQAHPGMRTLADFRGRRILVAKNGQPGEGRNRNGKSAKNLLVKVPVGTIIRNRRTGEVLGDLTKKRQKIEIVSGGKGGRGNASFATPTNRAPRKAERGEPGGKLDLTLELRLLADVGLVGLPNAGKSTLIGVVSTVRPKVADYPFTTLKPSVGVVSLGDFASFTMADIPGLIELAHEGKGLGHQFLRHVKRTSVLCHLVEIPLYHDGPEDRYDKMVIAYRTIRAELTEYDAGLAGKPELVCWTKADTLPGRELDDFRSGYVDRFIAETECPEPVHVISAVRGDGIGHLLGRLAEMLKLDLSGVRQDEVVPEYIDGDPPEGLSASELSMESLEEVEDEEAG
jgi:GTP-binding protein